MPPQPPILPGLVGGRSFRSDVQLESLQVWLTEYGHSGEVFEIEQWKTLRDAYSFPLDEFIDYVIPKVEQIAKTSKETTQEIIWLLLLVLILDLRMPELEQFHGKSEKTIRRYLNRISKWVVFRGKSNKTGYYQVTRSFVKILREFQPIDFKKS